MAERNLALMPDETSGKLTEVLLELSRRARQAEDSVELGFILVNDTHTLRSYRQAVLWLKDGGVSALSGVVQPEANAPYVQWLERVINSGPAHAATPQVLSAADLAPDLGKEWDEWLPAFAVWLPIASKRSVPEGRPGGLLLARDTNWQEAEISLLAEWVAIWSHAWSATFKPPRWNWRQRLTNLREGFKGGANIPIWKQARVRWALAIAALLLIPVRLTVLAPAELVPANPSVIRAPIDGVVGAFQVRPNEAVKAGQALLSFDESPLTSRLEVARQALSTAEAEYRQAAQLAVTDAKQKAQLAILAGKIEERRAEATYLQGQLERSRVVAPQDGIALFDDPSEWIGKPVITGERIMRIATPHDVEVEAWVNVGDAIPLGVDSPIALYLSAAPLSSVTARIRYVAHDAVQRPDGYYAYRVRARMDGTTTHRVGLKGTAKLSGDRVPLIYWVLRRPLASIRQMTGW